MKTLQQNWFTLRCSVPSLPGECESVCVCVCVCVTGSCVNVWMLWEASGGCMTAAVRLFYFIIYFLPSYNIHCVLMHF